MNPFTSDDARPGANQLRVSDGQHICLLFSDEPYVANLANAIALHTQATRQRERLEALVAESAREASIQRFLAEASRVLNASLEPARVLAPLPDLAAAHFGGSFRLELLRDGRLEPAGTAGQDGAPIRADVRRVLETGTPVLVAPRAGEDSRLVTPLRRHDHVVGVLTVVGRERALDARDLLTAEELAARIALQLENAELYERERRASRDRERLLTIVSHDLRNPLSSIALSLALVERSLRDRAGDEQLLRRVRVMRSSTERMERLVADLLDFSRFARGQLRIEKTPVSISELVAEAVEIHLPLAEDRGITLADSGAPELEAPLDRERMLQVLGNLLGNAIKFTAPGGRIDVGATVARDHVRLTVRDTGRGIAPELLPRVFEAYVQSGNGPRHGLGLGLAIVKALVEAHGGRVGLESRAGAGTSVTVELPLAASQRHAA